MPVNIDLGALVSGAMGRRREVGSEWARQEEARVDRMVKRLTEVYNDPRTWPDVKKKVGEQIFKLSEYTPDPNKRKPYTLPKDTFYSDKEFSAEGPKPQPTPKFAFKDFLKQAVDGVTGARQEEIDSTPLPSLFGSEMAGSEMRLPERARSAPEAPMLSPVPMSRDMPTRPDEAPTLPPGGGGIGDGMGMGTGMGMDLGGGGFDPFMSDEQFAQNQLKIQDLLQTVAAGTKRRIGQEDMRSQLEFLASLPEEQLKLAPMLQGIDAPSTRQAKYEEFVVAGPDGEAETVLAALDPMTRTFTTLEGAPLDPKAVIAKGRLIPITVAGPDGAPVIQFFDHAGKPVGTPTRKPAESERVKWVQDPVTGEWTSVVSPIVRIPGNAPLPRLGATPKATPAATPAVSAPATAPVSATPRPAAPAKVTSAVTPAPAGGAPSTVSAPVTGQPSGDDFNTRFDRALEFATSSLTKDVRQNAIRTAQGFKSSGDRVAMRAYIDRLLIDKLPASQSEDIKTMQSLVPLMTEVEELAKKLGSVPGVGGLGQGSIATQIDKVFANSEEEARTARQLIGNVNAAIARLRGGTTFTPNEKALLAQYSPTINEHSTVVLSKLKNLQKFIASKRDEILYAGQKDIYDLGGGTGSADIDEDEDFLNSVLGKGKGQ